MNCPTTDCRVKRQQTLLLLLAMLYLYTIYSKAFLRYQAVALEPHSGEVEEKLIANDDALQRVGIIHIASYVSTEYHLYIRLSRLSTHCSHLSFVYLFANFSLYFVFYSFNSSPFCLSWQPVHFWHINTAIGLKLLLNAGEDDDDYDEDKWQQSQISCTC